MPNEEKNGGGSSSPTEKIVMKKSPKQEFPPGWNEKKVLAVIAHYDQQTEDEAAAEIETASEAPGETWMSVPTDLVPAIARLIEDHEQKASPTAAPKGRASTTRTQRKRRGISATR